MDIIKGTIIDLASDRANGIAYLNLKSHFTGAVVSVPCDARRTAHRLADEFGAFFGGHDIYWIFEDPDPLDGYFVSVDRAPAWVVEAYAAP